MNKLALFLFLSSCLVAAKPHSCGHVPRTHSEKQQICYCDRKGFIFESFSHCRMVGFKEAAKLRDAECFKDDFHDNEGKYECRTFQVFSTSVVRSVNEPE